MQTDLTFFTNEPGSILLDRFRKTLRPGKYDEIVHRLSLMESEWGVKWNT